METRLEQHNSSPKQGLTYWMPKRDFLVTIEFKNAVPTTTVVRSDSYADPEVAYVAQFRRNLIGENSLTVGVNERGLLTSAKSTTTSQLSDAVAQLAGAAGTLSFAPSEAHVSRAFDCPSEGKLVLRAPLAKQSPSENSITAHFLGATNCDVRVVIKSIGNFDFKNETRIDKRARAGFFYRQDLPYLIDVTFGPWKYEFIGFSPSLSPTRFLPIKRSLFSDNDADITFNEGVPTKYGQVVDGEALAVFKLPAAIIKAYFDAVGAAFTSRKTALDNQASYLSSLIKLQEKQLETDKCLDAIATGDDQTIKVQCQ